MNTDREHSEQQTKQSRWGFRGMTVRDWLPIVGALLIPVVIALGTGWITWQQGNIENERAEAERELAEQRAQDEALQAYLGQMSMLMLEKDLRTSDADSAVRTLARARTLTVLRRLGPSRKSELVRFLLEAELITSVEPLTPPPIIVLAGADLSRADLSGAIMYGVNLNRADLSNANLSGAHLSGAELDFANLSNADLGDTYMPGVHLGTADLSNANLGGAYMDGAVLIEADLSNADLGGAFLRPSPAEGYADLNKANLRGADLSDAALRKANLSGANLHGADLSKADLSGANLRFAKLGQADLGDARGITNEELEQQSSSLEGATMPNGQKYEDWLKSKGRESDG